MVFGEAESINPKIDIGEVLVPTFAVREEGTGYHYLPPNIEAKPSSTPFKKLGFFSTRRVFRTKRAAFGQQTHHSEKLWTRS